MGIAYGLVLFQYIKNRKENETFKYIITGMTVLGFGGLGGELVDHYLGLSNSLLNDIEIVFEEAS